LFYNQLISIKPSAKLWLLTDRVHKLGRLDADVGLDVQYRSTFTVKLKLIRPIPPEGSYIF